MKPNYKRPTSFHSNDINNINAWRTSEHTYKLTNIKVENAIST